MNLRGIKAIEIESAEYGTATDIQLASNIVRQSLRSWRRGQRLPHKLRYRSDTIVITSAVVAPIRIYSNQLEPADSPKTGQGGAPKAMPNGGG